MKKKVLFVCIVITLLLLTACSQEITEKPGYNETNENFAGQAYYGFKNTEELTKGVPLDAGANVMVWQGPNNVPFKEAFKSVMPELDAIAAVSTGKWYVPPNSISWTQYKWWIDSIKSQNLLIESGNVKKGERYFIYLTGDATLTYTAETICNDPDNTYPNQNYRDLDESSLQKKTTVKYGTEEFTDQCSSDTRVIEGYCSPDGLSWNGYACPDNGKCVDGACQKPCKIGSESKTFTAKKDSSINLFFNKWSTVYKISNEQVQFSYFDTYDNYFGNYDIKVNECVIDKQNGVAFQVSKIGDQDIEFTVSYELSKVKPKEFNIKNTPITKFDGDEAISWNGKTTKLKGVFYNTDHITLVCSDPCPTELDSDIKHFLNMQAQVISCFETNYLLQFKPTNSKIKQFLYVLTVDKTKNKDLFFSQGQVDYSPTKDAIYEMQRLPGLYPPGSSYKTPKENIWADMHETKHILQAMMLGRTGKITSQYAEGNAIATESQLSCGVPVHADNRISNPGKNNWNCYKNGGTPKSCMILTLPTVSNYDVSCEELKEVTPHALGSMFYAAMNEEYGCGDQCMRNIYIKASQLTQPQGNEIFSWTGIKPTKVAQYTKYRADPAEFGTLLKQIADEETGKDTSFVFKKLCFPMK